LFEYLVKKCRNGFQMAKKPSRGQKDAWVTLLAEPDRTKDTLSPLAMRAIEHVGRRLAEEGYDFALTLDETGGVAYAEVHFRTLTKDPKAAASSTPLPGSASMHAPSPSRPLVHRHHRTLTN
jgi:hypothetical protein